MRRRKALRLSCAALHVLLVATVLDATAAQGPFGRADVRVLPGLADVPAAHVKHLSRDGDRALVWVPAATNLAAHIRVLDTRSGALIFDSRTEQTAARAFVDALLTADGRTLIYGEVDPQGSARTVRARELASSVEHTLFTGRPALVLSAVSDNGQVVAYAEQLPPAAIVVVQAGGALQRLDTAACPASSTSTRASGPVSLSGDGRYLTYLSVLQMQPLPRAPVVADAVTGVVTCLSNPNKGASDPWPGAAVSHDGRWILVPSDYPTFSSFTSVLIERATGRTMPVLPTFNRSRVADISDDSRYLLLTGAPLAETPFGLYLLDRDSGVVTEIEPPSRDRFVGSSALISGDGRTAAYHIVFGTAAAPQVVPHIATLNADADADGLTDAWETTFGLDPRDPADALLDQDGDGATAAQEFAAASHPRAPAVRHFAEGADGTFFSTSVALFNPSDTPVLANVRFLGPNGARAATPVWMPARSPAYLDADSLGMAFTEFSIVVESPVPLTVERRMTWDRTRVYGSHSSAGVAAPAPTWHFAEGATIGDIQTFFLLQNPGDAPAHVTMRYWLGDGTTEARTHHVPPASRLTVWANQEGHPLDAAEFATTIDADVPVVAERAVYRDGPGQPFSAGSVASGVATPETEWTFAEGATGAYFDTFLLLANPADVPATAEVQFRRAGIHLSQDDDLQRSYVIAPRSRRTVWVDHEDARLADTSVSAFVTSDMPIVAERAMWWPGPTAGTWHGTHAETGVRPGTLWAVADVEVGWTPEVDTFVCIGSRSFLGAALRVTLYFDDGTSSTKDLAVDSRFTLWPRHDFPESVGRRFAMTIESLEVLLAASPSLPRGRVPIVVEKVTYRGNFEAGAASSATRLPNPP